MADDERRGSPLVDAHLAVVRDERSTADELRESLRWLGAECGRAVQARLGLEPARIRTPMGEFVQTTGFARVSYAVVSTRADFSAFGSSIAAELRTTLVGYMDFGPVRGRAVLTAPVREIELPHAAVNPDVLVVAKSVLATGCTAVSLARTAERVYRPRAVVIVSVFHSRDGLLELEQEYPSAQIIVLGSPDSIDEAGMLHPGIGDLDRRMEDE